MSASSLPVSVTSPLTPAYERTKSALFAPFDLNKWLVIGFCAWLAGLGKTPGSGAFFRFGGGPHPGFDLHSALEQARDYILANLHWLVPLAVGLGLVGFGFWLLFLWLSSRGQFMLVDCIAWNKAEVAEPWTKYSRQSNSLFLFRVCLGLLGSLLALPLIAFTIWSVNQVIKGDNEFGSMILRFLLLGSGVATVACLFALVHKLTIDFVVPMMYLRGTTCWAAWRQFLSLAAEHLGSFVLYILFSILLAIALRFLVLAVVLVTCCVAGCLLAIPYFGAVFLLPITLFWRSYSLDYLAQFGSAYNVFAR